MKNITFINAGAGSGKTFRLTEDLFKIIDSKKCKAHEVLVTTFTKKAAEEIKIKARENLLEKGLANEANELQNAYIGTIHSVGSQIIKKFWHYIGFPKEIRVMDDDDTSFYFNQAISSVPTKEELIEIQDINFRFNPTGGTYNQYDANKWQGDLLKIINLSRDNYITDFTSSKAISLKNAKTLLNSDGNIIDIDFIKKTVKTIIDIGESLSDTGNGKRKGKIIKLKSIVNLNYSDLVNLKNIIDDLIKKKYDNGKLDNASNQLEKIHRSKNIISDIERYNDLLFDIAERSIEKYANYKQEIGLIDYSDMEDGFLRLLDIDAVREEIKNTIKLVLVDEFQDSSPIQLAIFIKLSEIVENNIWVGDPKQSIYGFRGTDPLLIDAIIKKFESGEGENLNTDNLEYSWRSRPEIVNVVNKVFVPALKDQVEEKNISLKEVRTNKGFKKSALQHFNFDEEKSNKDYYYRAVAKSIVKILGEEWIVSDKNKSTPDIDPKKEIVQTGVVKAGDISILCKSNEGVETISRELSALGIKVASEISGLGNTAEYKLLISIIKLLQSQENTLAKAEIRVLTESGYTASKLIDDRLEFLDNLPDRPTKPSKTEDISIEEFDELNEIYVQEIQEYYNELKSWGNENSLVQGIANITKEIIELPIPQLIEHLINRLDIYSVVAKWDNAEQRRGNLQKIIEYAYKYDERCVNMSLGASLSGLIYYLGQMDIGESKSTSNDSVNIFTYHGSKGLEWPIVILTEFQKEVNWAFISRNVFGIRIKNEEEIDLNNILGNRSISVIPWVFGPPQAKVSDDFINNIIDTTIYTKAELEHNNELKRLMYVGMTRPRDYLITTSISGQKKYDWIDLVNNHVGWNYANATKVITDKTDVFGREIYSEPHNLSSENIDVAFVKNRNEYFIGKEINYERNYQPYFISPSNTKYEDKVDVSLFDDVQNRIPIGTSLSGKEDILGNCLHKILYLYIGNKLENNVSNIEDKVSRIIDNYNLSNAINSNDITSSIEKLFDYLNAKFSPINWHIELPLEVEIDKQLYKGEIDLLIETKEGYILIDYKSYPGSVENLLDTKSTNYAGKYAGQLSTYTAMLETTTTKKVIKKLIYYTVLGKIVEVDI